jgi:hypothetical protein
VRSRLTDFYPKTGETSVTLVMLDGTIKEVTQGSEQQPQTTTPTETGKPKKEVKQTETGQSQGKPGKRPKKEVKRTGTAVKHILAKRNAKPETSVAGHPVIELGAGILLNQLGRVGRGGGHDMGHHEMNGFMHGGNRGMMLGL